MESKPIIGHSQDQFELQSIIFEVEQTLLDIKRELLKENYRQASKFASQLPHHAGNLLRLLRAISCRPLVARNFSDATEEESQQLSNLNCEIAGINDELVRIKRTIESSILGHMDLCPYLTYQGYSVIMTCRRTKPYCSMPPLEAFLTFDQENRFNLNPKCWGNAVDSQEHCGLFSDLYHSLPTVWLDEILRIRTLSFQMKFSLQIEFKLSAAGASKPENYRKK